MGRWISFLGLEYRRILFVVSIFCSIFFGWVSNIYAQQCAAPSCEELADTMDYTSVITNTTYPLVDHMYIEQTPDLMIHEIYSDILPLPSPDENSTEFIQVFDNVDEYSYGWNPWTHVNYQVDDHTNDMVVRFKYPLITDSVHTCTIEAIDNASYMIYSGADEVAYVYADVKVMWVESWWCDPSNVYFEEEAMERAVWYVHRDDIQSTVMTGEVCIEYTWDLSTYALASLVGEYSGNFSECASPPCTLRMWTQSYGLWNKMGSVSYLEDYPPTESCDVCDNGVIDVWEQCDHGDGNGNDGICTSTCLFQPICSLQVEPGTTFSGNTVSISSQYITGSMNISDLDFGDGTTGAITTTWYAYSSWWNYTISFSVTNTEDTNLSVTCTDMVEVVSCGNGNIDPGEECGEPGLSCAWSGSCEDCICLPPLCGNGDLDLGEECDDGNDTDNGWNTDGSNNDACTDECKLADCGDGYMQSYGIGDGIGAGIQPWWSPTCLGVCAGGDNVWWWCDTDDPDCPDGLWFSTCLLWSTALANNASGYCNQESTSPNSYCTTDENCVIKWACQIADTVCPAWGDDSGCYQWSPDGLCAPERGETPANCTSDCGSAWDNSGCYEWAPNGMCQSLLGENRENCEDDCGGNSGSYSEECDDGNTSNNDWCLNDCTLNVCGDGYVYFGAEDCDTEPWCTPVSWPKECSRIIPICTLTANPHAVTTSGEVVTATSTYNSTWVIFTPFFFGDGTSTGVATTLEHLYTINGKYQQNFTVYNMGNPIMYRTCEDIVDVNICTYGSGSFGGVMEKIAFYNLGWVVVGDINGDGIIDVARWVVGRNTLPNVNEFFPAVAVFYLGQQGGTVRWWILGWYDGLTSSDLGMILSDFVDIDNDGDSDLYFSSYYDETTGELWTIWSFYGYTTESCP